MARGRRRPRPRRSRRTGLDWRPIIGTLLVATALLGLGTLAYFNVTLRDRHPPSPDTLCPEGGPTSIFAVLLDVTDSLSEQQRSVIVGRLRERIRALPEGTLVALAQVSPDPAAAGTPAFMRCKPRRGDHANPLHENPRLIQERYASGFDAPLEQALTALVSAPPADQSPIMESLQALVSQAFPFRHRPPSARLVIISDLLQHSPVFSFYRGGDWASFERSGVFTRLGHNLEGVDVTLEQLPRPEQAARQARKVPAFWAGYFDHQGARSVSRQIIGDL